MALTDRSTRKFDAVFVRLPPELRDQVRHASHSLGESQSTLIRQWIRAGLAAEGQANGER